MFADFEFEPSAGPPTDPELGPSPSALELAEHLARPGAEARLRAAAESDLGGTVDLGGPELLAHALTLLEQGRLFADRRDDVLAGADPKHPAGNPLEDLGNLTDLIVDLADEDSDDHDTKPAPPRPTWIEIAIVDGLGEPVRNRPYRLHLPDGSVREGELDDSGIIRFDDVDPGACRLELPTADDSEWDPKYEAESAEEAA